MPGFAQPIERLGGRLLDINDTVTADDRQVETAPEGLHGLRLAPLGSGRLLGRVVATEGFEGLLGFVAHETVLVADEVAAQVEATAIGGLGVGEAPHRLEGGAVAIDGAAIAGVRLGLGLPHAEGHRHVLPDLGQLGEILPHLRPTAGEGLLKENSSAKKFSMTENRR